MNPLSLKPGESDYDYLKTFLEGRTMGLEPTNGGTTNHCLNHLATLAIAFTNIASDRPFAQHEPELSQENRRLGM